MLKNIKRTYKQFILYKSVGIYQSTMAYGFSYDQAINCLISQPKHMLWVLKRTATIRRFI